MDELSGSRSKGNLKTILKKFKELQIDDRGKGVILSYDEPTDSIIVVDRGLLFYRKYTTRKWPWEEIALEALEKGSGLGDDA